jgi:hypothetical protein
VSLVSQAAVASRRSRVAPEDLAWVGLIVAAVLLATIFAWVAPSLAKLYPTPDQTLFVTWQHYGYPEPLEDVRSMLALAMPFAVTAAVVLFGAERPARRSLDAPLIAAQVVTLGLLAWAVLGQQTALPIAGTGYFDRFLLSIPVLIAGLFIGVVLTELILWWWGPLPRALSRVRSLADRPRLVLAVAIVATALFLLPAVVTDSTIAHNGPLAHEISPAAEDYMAVINGRTPLVDYIAQYANVLPFAVAPLLGALDSSLTAYSLIMCTLSAVGLLAVFGVLNETTERPWVALGLYVPFLALALFPWHDHGAARDFAGNYYATLPDRLLGPFVLAWLCALWTRGRGLPIWAMSLVAGLTALNNSEFGVAALIALVLAVAAGGPRTGSPRGAWSRLGVEAISGLAGAVALVCLLTLTRTGELPAPSLLTYYSHLFLREGYALLPMPTRGLQWALYATYTGALLTAAVRWARRAPDRTLTAMLAFSGAFGLITGMYFVGRSVPKQLMLLFPVWALSLALVAWAAALALRSVRTDRVRLHRVLLPCAAALIGFGVMIAAIGRVSPPWRQIDRLTSGGSSVDDTPDAQRFVDAHTDAGEPAVLIGMPLAHRLADRAGVSNVSPLNGLVSLISPAEADRSLDELEASEGDKVFEAVTAPSPINPSLLRVPEFAAMLRQRGFRMAEQDPSTGIRLWMRR